MTRRNQYLFLIGVMALFILGPVHAQEDSPAAPEPTVNFSFDQVEIRLLVKIVGESTGKKFVVDDDVTGKVTVVTPKPIPTSEVYPLFLSVLESSGYSVVEKQDAFHIVTLKEREVPGAPIVGPSETSPSSGLITKLIKINHISAIELKKIVEPMVAGGASGTVAAFGATNHLILTDTAENIARIEKLVAELDQAGQARMVEVIQLKHASAADLARELTAALQGAATAGQKLSRHVRQVTEGGASIPTDVTLVATPRANSLVVVGTPVQLAEVKRVIAELDIENRAGYARLNAIVLNYLSAEEAAKSLKALLAQTISKDQRVRIAIEPSISNNALLIDADPKDFEVVKNLVTELDKIPQQVLVEVLVAEVTTGDDLEFGVELSTIDVPEDGSTTVVARNRPADPDVLSQLATNFFPQGLTFALSEGTFVDPTGAIIPKVPFILNALEENREVSILANIPLWAQNNIEATANVVDDIPILTSTITGSGTARDVIETIERLEVGIKLSVTPHINPDGDITMQLNPRIEAIVGQTAGSNFAPTIAKREVSTTVTVPDQSTVIISGLIREDHVSEVSKIPILGDIPVLGFLFRNTTDKKMRTNLLIFVTPRIVTDPGEATAARLELEGRTGLSLPDVRLQLDEEDEDELVGE